VVFHDPGYPVLSVFKPLRIELRGDPRTPIELSAFRVDHPYVPQQFLIVFPPSARQTITPRIIPAFGYLHNTSHILSTLYVSLCSSINPYSSALFGEYGQGFFKNVPLFSYLF